MLYLGGHGSDTRLTAAQLAKMEGPVRAAVRMVFPVANRLRVPARLDASASIGQSSSTDFRPGISQQGRVRASQPDGRDSSKRAHLSTCGCPRIRRCGFERSAVHPREMCADPTAQVFGSSARRDWEKRKIGMTQVLLLLSCDVDQLRIGPVIGRELGEYEGSMCFFRETSFGPNERSYLALMDTQEIEAPSHAFLAQIEKMSKAVNLISSLITPRQLQHGKMWFPPSGNIKT